MSNTIKFLILTIHDGDIHHVLYREVDDLPSVGATFELYSDDDEWENLWVSVGEQKWYGDGRCEAHIALDVSKRVETRGLAVLRAEEILLNVGWRRRH